MEDKIEGHRELIAGINHMAWLLDIRDKDGVDLYPEIRKRAAKRNESETHDDMVRYKYIRRLGYYCTESSEHNAEYNPFFIKSKYPELIEKYNIPIDEYPRRCIQQVAALENQDFDAFKRRIRESGDSSFKYLQNVYATKCVEQQSVSVALALSDEILGSRGVSRVHGGGFAGTIQAFVPNELVQEYKERMEQVFGEDACYVLSVRPVGGIKIV